MYAFLKKIFKKDSTSNLKMKIMFHCRGILYSHERITSKSLSLIVHKTFTVTNISANRYKCIMALFLMFWEDKTTKNQLRFFGTVKTYTSHISTYIKDWPKAIPFSHSKSVWLATKSSQSFWWAKCNSQNSVNFIDSISNHLNNKSTYKTNIYIYTHVTHLLQTTVPHPCAQTMPWPEHLLQLFSVLQMPARIWSHYPT